MLLNPCEDCSSKSDFSTFPAIIGDELMPAIFAVNPSTGVVMSPFVRYVRELFSSF